MGMLQWEPTDQTPLQRNLLLFGMYWFWDEYEDQSSYVERFPRVLVNVLKRVSSSPSHIYTHKKMMIMKRLID